MDKRERMQSTRTPLAAALVLCMLALVLAACGLTAGDDKTADEPGSTQELELVDSSAKEGAGDAKAVIGIAWRSDPDSEFYTNVCTAIEEAGGTCVMLPQVTSPDFAYDKAGDLTQGVAETGALDEPAGKLVRCNSWRGSNAAEAVSGVDAVVFPVARTSARASCTGNRSGTASRPSATTTRRATSRTT